MSVIQKIRDKYARIAVIAIAVSLLGFIMMDAFAGKTGLFSNNQSNVLGKVNGKSIDRIAFEQEVKYQEDMAAQSGYQINDEARQQIEKGMWDQKVSDIIMQGEYDKLGLTITDKEVRDVLYGDTPPEFLRREFTDSSGKFDAASAQMQVNALLKSNDPNRASAKDFVNRQIDMAKKQRLLSKYMALLTSTIYFPKWFLEKQNVDNSLIGKASYVSVAYSSIPDSTVKVTDEDIQNYINEHKDDFQQKDETRSINYVVFSAAASSADSAALKSQLQSLKEQFATAKDPSAFLQQQGSTMNYFDGYLAKSAIQVPAKDSIFALAKGGVYGPYLDGKDYVLAKMIDEKPMPDSAKVKHILIATTDPRSGQMILPDSVAKKKIDSIKLAIDRGANFDTLALKLSDDKSSAIHGGLVEIPNQQTGQTPEYISQGQTVKAFNDSVFNGRIGEELIVKSEFGYHLIKILDLKNIEPHYKIAYLAKEIDPSTDTENDAQNAANSFFGKSQNYKAFTDNANQMKSKGINLLTANDIGGMDYSIPGISGNARAFIKKIFDASSGDVIEPQFVGDNYIVAVVTQINKPGLQSVAKVRPMIEPMLRNRKKAEVIIKNIGQVNSLEDLAAKEKTTVQTLDSIRFNGGRALGYEPKVLGAVFNPANKGKISPAIAGQAGVYVIRVENTSTTPVENANIADQQKMLENQAKQQLMSQLQQGYNPIADILKKTATIKDYRSKFY